ncbi:glycoside hydrolase family 18 protein [Paenibacillus sp. Marseille-Q4541]|uniref:glycoside hydrolase family 18 protein n=1 Tax=Paenibacillus sp. Marseille-Q4541 TaxID=2831522 RepID=UPI001BA6A17A|nr:glycoside hydrolase family 18 protein [Paenibacillus sp. Marseille-Q4541]
MSDYILCGYVTSAGLSDVTKQDAAKLTHIHVAFAHIVNGRIHYDSRATIQQVLRLKAINPDLRILISVGGWSAGGFSEAAASEQSRIQIAESCEELLSKYPFDGIDLDWEYPCYSEAGITSSPADKTNFTLLLKTIRQRLDQYGEQTGRYYLLTIAAGADQYYVDGTEMNLVHPYLDYVQLMTYDMRGGFQTLTGHHTNLYTSTGDLFRISVDASVQIFMNAGVPAHKLVIGAAFYSRMWKNVPSTNSGYLQMSPSSGGYGPNYGKLVQEYIGGGTFTRYWDDEAKAPFLFDGSTFITYDDPESLSYKSTYVREKNLAGIMFWEYTCDPTSTLITAMDQALRQ